MKWNLKNSTYYDKGKKAYGFGDELPEEVLEGMGKETLDEYVKKGLIAKKAIPEKIEPVITEEELAENKRQVLIERAKVYGLKPHPKTGIAKLEIMIEDYEALQALKAEALELGIDPSDDVSFAELFELVEDKKAENESDS